MGARKEYRVLRAIRQCLIAAGYMFLAVERRIGFCPGNSPAERGVLHYFPGAWKRRYHCHQHEQLLDCNRVLHELRWHPRLFAGYIGTVRLV